MTVRALRPTSSFCFLNLSSSSRDREGDDHLVVIKHEQRGGIVQQDIGV